MIPAWLIENLERLREEQQRKEQERLQLPLPEQPEDVRRDEEPLAPAYKF